ncbi:MAG: hypothetical protein AAFW68_02415 [Pseudomonadota bacterium]
MFNKPSATAFLIAMFASFSVAAQKQLADAVTDSDYKHAFTPLDQQHGTRVLIDRFHQTIYTNDEGTTGAEVMLEIMERDGFDTGFADTPLTSASLQNADILIIHGLPNERVELASGETFHHSPLSAEEVEAIVRFVDEGGGLYLSLSHFPGGSGAAPLLNAFSVKFRDGYIYSKAYPSFTDHENGRCSHYFGMSRGDDTLNADHPMIKNGLPVERIDYHCGAAIFRNPEDAVLPFPKGSENHIDGTLNTEHVIYETSDSYAGMIGFNFGKGKVVAAADQGMFRNFIFTFDTDERVYVTITSPDNDNANLFVNMMRWLSPKIGE